MLGCLWGSPDKLHDARRCRHGESTDAHGFRNGAVAKIGGGIVFAESGEVEPLHHLGRTGEPLVAGTAHLDAELDAIPGHDSDQAAVRDVGSRHECDLCRSHREVQVEMVVAGDKIQHIGDLILREVTSDQGRHDLPKEK